MTTSFKERNLLAVIGDEVCVREQSFVHQFTHMPCTKDTITGLLLAGIGQVDRGKKNFLVVDLSMMIHCLISAETDHTRRNPGVDD